MLFACVVRAISIGLMLTVSRCREYAADRGSALITGAPEQLMSALQKIAGKMPQIPEDDLRGVASMSAFFIVPPKLQSLTHPSLERRLARLADVSRELGKPDHPANDVGTAAVARPGNFAVAVAAFAVVFATIVVLGKVLL